MKTREKTRAMVESALIVALAVVFALAGIYIPLLSYALIFLPVPFIIIGVKHGIKYNILAVIAAAIIIGSMTEPMRALFIAVTGGLNSIVVGYMIQKKHPVSRIMFWGSIASIVASVLSLGLVSYLMNMNIIDIIEDTFTMTNEIYEGIFKNVGTDENRIKELKTMMENAKNMAIMLLPSSVIFVSVILTYINYLVSGIVLKRMGKEIQKPKKFSQFRLPKNILMGTIIILVLTYLVSGMNIVNYQTLFANVFYIFFIIYLIQGISVVSFYMTNHGIGRFLKAIIIFIILSMPGVAMILSLLGLGDVIFNIRKLEN